ncbi:hypothetical protein FKM82_031409 [Ascaphus truei]
MIQGFELNGQDIRSRPVISSKKEGKQNGYSKYVLNYVTLNDILYTCTYNMLQCNILKCICFDQRRWEKQRARMQGGEQRPV